MNALTQLGFSSAPLLTVIQADDFSSLADLAAKAGRDKRNISRDLTTLEEAGLVVRAEPSKPTLTPAGVDQLAAVDRANAPVVLHDQIEADPLNPRRVFHDEALTALADSIYDDGKLTLLQPLVIRPREGGPKPFRLVAGERRWRAIGRLIADGRWPAELPVPTSIRVLSDEEAAVLALVENMQREDLSAVDEALTFEHLAETLGWSNADIAKHIKRTPEYVQQRRRVLKLPEEIQSRMRLPKSDENRIGFKEARKMFTVSKEPTRPKAPELSPKLALALLELADKIEAAPMTLNGEVGFTVLAQRPTGGALATLHERKILNLREWGGQVFAKIQLYTSGAVTFLEDVGFYGPKRVEVIWAARTAIMSPQRASEATRGGKYITPELNTELAAEEPAEADTDDAVAEESVTGKPVASAGVRRDRPTAEDRAAASIQADRNARETRLTELGADLPATLEEMAPHARQAMEDYDRAQITGDETAAKAARELFDACAYKLNGSKLLGAATPSDQLRQTFAAPIGEVPKWGQPGRFLLSIDGMTAAVEIKDNFGWSNVGFYAVDPDAPFFSPTGFRSDFFGHGLQELKTTDGASVLVATARMMRANIVEYLRPRKPAAIDRESIARHFEYYPWIGELAGLVKHDGAAAIEEHEAAVEARQDAAETNPVRVEPTHSPAFNEDQAEDVMSKVNQTIADIWEEITSRPTYSPSQTHLFVLADKAVWSIFKGDAPAFLALYGRMLTAAHPGQVKDEIQKTFKRLGVDWRSIERALAGDSPDYVETHRDCHGMVTADEHGLPMIADDPRAPVDEEDEF